MFGTGLLVFLESSNYPGAIVDGEEFSLVREIVDHPVRNDTNDYGNQTFEDEDPSLNGELLEFMASSVRRSILLTQPGLPPTPFICAIPAARRPPNDPASAAAEKKMAARIPSSLRLYQHER
jgi:hypothetical protein